MTIINCQIGTMIDRDCELWRHIHKGESDNEGPWLNWDWKWICIIDMVKKISAAVTEFSQEIENFHPCISDHYAAICQIHDYLPVVLGGPCHRLILLPQHAAPPCSPPAGWTAAPLQHLLVRCHVSAHGPGVSAASSAAHYLAPASPSTPPPSESIAKSLWWFPCLELKIKQNYCYAINGYDQQPKLYIKISCHMQKMNIQCIFFLYLMNCMFWIYFLILNHNTNKIFLLTA